MTDSFIYWWVLGQMNFEKNCLALSVLSKKVILLSLAIKNLNALKKVELISCAIFLTN